ncbi:MAG: polysaccharide lyase family 7 protein [Verrucomicrobiota bacterium]|jgi:PKD repeat protein
MKKLTLISGLVLATVLSASSQNIAGDIAVVQIGDGVQTLATTGNSVSIDAFTTGGGVVGTVAIPNATLINSGTSSSEGFLSTSSDGTLLSLAGYSGVGVSSGQNLPNVSAVLANRGVASVPVGNFNAGAVALAGYTTNRLNGSSTTAGNPRSGIIAGGNTCIGGSASASSSAGVFTTTQPSTTTIYNTSGPRQLGFINGNLAYDSTAGLSVFSGIPTAAATPTTYTGLNSGNLNPQGWAVSGNTLYVADGGSTSAADVGGIYKYTISGTSLTFQYVLDATTAGANSGVWGLALNGSTLYGTTVTSGSFVGNSLIGITDTGAGSAVSTLATAAANTEFKGVQFISPVPPNVMVSPASTNIVYGNSVTLTANATGTSPLAYQWFDNHTNAMAGQTNATLTVTAVTNSGNYTVIVTNAFGLATNFAAVTLVNLNSSLPPGSNFDLSHWYLQLPTANGVLTGTAGTVDSATTAQLVAGFTNAYFYTGPDGAMTFWVPDDGATTSGSTHPRSELREEIVPGNANTNWTLYGTHIMTATCVVSNVPSDTGKVCIGQIHEPNYLTDGVTPGANNEEQIMFDLPDQKIYANINLDGNTDSTFSVTFTNGPGVALGNTISYMMSVVNGILTIMVNNVTNSWNLFSGTNYQGHVAQNWGTGSGNSVYFKAGDYNQTTNGCGCSTDGAKVAFYALTRYHAPAITNPPVSTTVMAGQGASFTVGASSTGTLGYQWWWNATNMLAGATGATLTLANVSATNAGNYTVVVSDNTPSFSSVTSSVVTLTVNQAVPFENAAPVASAICLGNALSSSTITGASFTNASGVAVTMTATNFVNPSLVPNQAGPTNLLVYFTPGDLTDYTYVTNTVTVIVNTLPTPTAGNNGPVCVGSTLSLTSSGGVGYTWSGPKGFSSTQQNPTVSTSATLAMAGTYTVTVTNASGCTASTTTAVTVNALPTVSVNSATISVGGSATLTASNNASSPSYFWSPGGATTQSITVSPTVTTTYTVMVTDGTTGCANSGSGTVTVNSVTALVVTNAADSGPGTLRQAIQYLTGGGTITFATNLSGATILLTNGELLLNQNLTIDGSGLANGISINGNNAHRVFEIASGTNIFIALTITNGEDNNDDGVNGGGGGGIYIDSSGNLTLTNCTVAGNSATNSYEGGGGIDNDGTLTVNQSTISGNSANNSNEGGGGIDNDGTLMVNQSTISGNSADNSNGGGIFNDGSTTATNSIIANNTATGGLGPDYSDDDSNYDFANGALYFGGVNLVQVAPYVDGFLTGTYVTAPPNLAPLGNYGGPTQTMPPLPGSPAIGAGSLAANTFTNDQRGYPRTQNGMIDIGAVELPTLQFTASPTNGTAPLQVQFTSTNVDSDGSPITQWNWSFNDGYTGTNQNPAHIYAGGIFTPALVVTNSVGLTLAASGPSITVAFSVELVLNGGFETGDFTGWTLSGGDPGNNFVDNGTFTGILPYTGSYLAALGSYGSLSFLSQSLATTPGTSYLLSFWLNSPDGLTPNQFLVSWNENTLFDETNLPALGWTNLQFVVTATGTNTVLQFGFRDDPSYLGLDDINVVPAQPGIASFSLSGTNLVINGTNGFSGLTYYVLTSTNVALPLNLWTPVATNVLNASGNFTITATNAVNHNVPQCFYILQMP